MKSCRHAEISLIAIAIAAYTVTSVLSVPSQRSLDPIMFAFLCAIPIVGAFFITPLLRHAAWLDYGIPLVAVTAAIGKNNFFFCPGKIYTLISFSLVYHLGQAACVLGIWEIYRRRRSSTFVVFYSFLILSAASYTSVTSILMPFLVVYAVCLVWLGRCRVGAMGQPVRGKSDWKAACAVILLFALTAAWFLARYRQELNDWNPGAGQEERQSGFSPVSELGNKNIQTSRQAVLRYFAPRGIHYLRGKVFDTYRDGRWFSSNPERRPLPLRNGVFGEKTREGRLLLFLHVGDPLFAPLDWQAVASAADALHVDDDRIIMAIPPVDAARIYVEARSDKAVPAPERYREIPAKLSYIRRLAGELTEKTTDPQEKIRVLADYLGSAHLYSRITSLDKGEDPIENFLRCKRPGHCEMFASSLVMLSRACGIPARYVGGYYAHEWNEPGKFITVRECDAHAWTEVWLPQRGWVTVDAVPAQNLQGGEPGEWGETYRDLAAEYLRRSFLFLENHWPTLLAFIALAVAVYRFFPRAIRFPTRRSPLLRLAAAYGKAAGKIARPRRANETWREYNAAVAAKLPAEWNDFAALLLTALERHLYHEEEVSEQEIAKLKKIYTRTHICS